MSVIEKDVQIEMFEVSYPKVAIGLAGAYVTLEVINHVVVGTWLAPYLATLGVSTGIVTGIGYALVAGAVLGVSYLIYKAVKHLTTTRTIKAVFPVPTTA